MKAAFKNSLFHFILINLIKIINLYDIEIVDTNLNFIHALSLKNGNIFLLHKNGVIVYNYNMTIILHNHEHLFISSEYENNLTAVIQCEDNNNHYIIALINNNLHIFTSRGQFLFTISNKLLDDLSVELVFVSYSFLYYKYDGSLYYFIISYTKTDKNIKVIEFTIDMNAQTYNEYKTNTHFIENMVSDSASSQIVKTNGFNNILAVISLIKEVIDQYNQKFYFVLSLFDIENNLEMYKETNFDLNIWPQSKLNYVVKSVINKDKDKIFINYAYLGLASLGWFGFYFNSFKMTSLNNGVNCNSDTKLIKKIILII